MQAKGDFLLCLFLLLWKKSFSSSEAHGQPARQLWFGFLRSFQKRGCIQLLVPRAATKARHRTDLLSPSFGPFPHLVVHLSQPTVGSILFKLISCMLLQSSSHQNEKTCCHLPSSSLSDVVVLNLSYTLISSWEIEKNKAFWDPPSEILIQLVWACVVGQASPVVRMYSQGCKPPTLRSVRDTHRLLHSSQSSEEICLIKEFLKTHISPPPIPSTHRKFLGSILPISSLIFIDMD